LAAAAVAIGTKPNVAAIGPPSLSIAQAREPEEIFGKVLNFFELF
jgi:hypothetical protein